jgi:hypothetical protein
VIVDRAVLVGGPHDGYVTNIDDGWQEIRMPAPPASPVWISKETVWPPPCPISVYRRLRDPAGWPSRDDEGRLRFGYGGYRGM